MHLLIDINHPAHIHFFKHLIKIQQDMGNTITVTASKKDITVQLLQELNISFIYVGSYGKSLLSKIIQIPIMAFRLFHIAKKLKPDMMLGIASSRIAHAGWLLNIRTLIFTDTEHASEQIALFKTFADNIITPTCFYKNFGKKHVRYDGFHELAYLHPDLFTPNEHAFRELELSSQEKLFILRFVAWNASHDMGQKGISDQCKIELVSLLNQHGKVIITSETPLPEKLKKYEYKIAASKMHDLLAFATLYIGEGGTMADEAAVLGVPSILVNSLYIGVFGELQHYELLYHLKSDEKLLQTVKTLLNQTDLKEIWTKKREKLLSEKENVTEWMNLYIENCST